MSKCKCKSAPKYHRNDCPIYDIDGNKKILVDKNSLELAINNTLQNYINDVIPFYIKIETITTTNADIIAIDKANHTKVSIKDIHQYTQDYLKLITKELKISHNIDLNFL